MAVSEMQESAIFFNSGGSSGLGTGNVGTWTYDTNTAYSGGNAMYSATANDTATITFSGRALYLVTRTNGHGASDGGELTVTVDGVSLPGKFSCMNGSPVSSGSWYRYLVPIARFLADGPHTVVLTAVGGKNVYVDSALVVTGAKVEPGAGNLVVLGDSWMNGVTGASQPLNTCVSRLAGALAAKQSRPISLVNRGVTGDRWYGTTNVLVGGMYRLFGQVVGDQPEMLVMLFGANDLGGAGGGSTGDWYRTLSNALCFLEDAFDVASMNVVLCTPGYSASALTMPSYVVPSSGSGGSPLEMWEQAVAVTHQVVAAFPWCKLGQVYEAMDMRASLVYPNSNGDLGNHPNDFGHGVIAAEMARALLGGVA